jgi:hypothetical protein
MSGMAERKPADVLDALARDVRLLGFLRDGKIDTMPAKQSRRRQLLAEVAQVFEPGVRYPEGQVNITLGALYPDYAALRRYLVDEDFLDRAGGEYWRVGGPVSS